jgi:hypothetical protein
MNKGRNCLHVEDNQFEGTPRSDNRAVAVTVAGRHQNAIMSDGRSVGDVQRHGVDQIHGRTYAIAFPTVLIVTVKIKSKDFLVVWESARDPS